MKQNHLGNGCAMCRGVNFLGMANSFDGNAAAFIVITISEFRYRSICSLFALPGMSRRTVESMELGLAWVQESLLRMLLLHLA
jgi:hypothetical protein